MRAKDKNTGTYHHPDAIAFGSARKELPVLPESLLQATKYPTAFMIS